VGPVPSRIDVNQEEMRAQVSAIHRNELEETAKHQAEDVLACVYQRMQGLCKELNEKIDETQRTYSP
jgi:uncharacterized alpha-E superfamily protein